MKLGLVGFPQVGKRTLFELLTGHAPGVERGLEPYPGLAEAAAKEKDLMHRLREHLEGGARLEGFEFLEEDSRIANGRPFLTRKPVIVVLNTDEERMEDTRAVVESTSEFDEKGFRWVVVSAQVEQEILRLDVEEREIFLRDLGITEPAIDRLTRECYDALGPDILLHGWGR